jgi:hypothetical protein
VSGQWKPGRDSAVARARRTVSLSTVRAGLAGLSRHQRSRGAVPPGPPPDAAWNTARLLAANLAVLSALTAVVLVVAGVLPDVTRQVYFVIFILLTLFLLRRGARLRRRGLERLGRSLTAWAGVTGVLVVVAGALTVGLTRFLPELLAVSAGWLLVLGVWTDLAALVTAAVVLVVPVVWGAFVWDRSLVGAVLIVVAAGAYARSGTARPALFGAVVVAGVLVAAAAVHELVHPRGVLAFDGADLLAVVIILAALAAAGEVESWRADWLALGTVVRTVTTAAALVLAALAARPGAVEGWAETAPAAAIPRIVVAGVVVMIALWVTVLRRPVRPGGRLRIGAWTLAAVLLFGALSDAYSLDVVRWAAVAALAIWGLRAVRNGLRRSRAWSVAGGFAVLLGATLPIVAPQGGLVPVVLLLVAIAAAGAAVVMLNRPQEDNALPVPEGAH